MKPYGVDEVLSLCLEYGIQNLKYMRCNIYKVQFCFLPTKEYCWKVYQTQLFLKHNVEQPLFARLSAIYGSQQRQSFETQQ